MPSQACKHLRTKKMYIPEEAEEALLDSGQPDEPPHCWCNKTMTEVGLDDEPVYLKACSSTTRSCYQSS